MSENQYIPEELGGGPDRNIGGQFSQSAEIAREVASVLRRELQGDQEAKQAEMREMCKEKHFSVEELDGGFLLTLQDSYGLGGPYGRGKKTLCMNKDALIDKIRSLI